MWPYFVVVVSLNQLTGGYLILLGCGLTLFTIAGLFSFAGNGSCWGWSDFMLLGIWKHWVLACLAGSNCIGKADIH
jgi:hypothetical protein